MTKYRDIKFEISVSDETLVEAESKYDNVCKIMQLEEVANKKWMLRSDIFIFSQFGDANMICHFYDDGKIYIYDYSLRSSDIHYNTDIIFLSQWAQSNGWKKPRPLPFLIESSIEFWKLQWETFLIDSEYFDEKYGNRETLEFYKNDDE